MELLLSVWAFPGAGSSGEEKEKRKNVCSPEILLLLSAFPLISAND
jgi:hypothetical protein